MSEAERSQASQWSDPFIGLQVANYHKYLDERDLKVLAAPDVVEIAEYLNSWSRELLNRIPGRTTPAEKAELQILFFDSVSILEVSSSGMRDDSELQRVKGYIGRIRERADSLIAH